MSLITLTDRMVRDLQESRKELDKIRNSLEILRKQWSDNDRPRLTNMYITEDKREAFKNATLEQVINEIIRDWNEKHPGMQLNNDGTLKTT